jgi:hypothetical protein
MLSQGHFYHRITRKLVVGFGTIFNNIKLYRYDKSGVNEIERVTVPLMYSTKEKFYQRITQDPELTREVQMTLPRMAFELNSITYDPLRKVSSFNKQFVPNSNNIVKSITSAPYNFDFTLSIYVRNTEDGTQIIEQILPYFSPDYTITMDLLGYPNYKLDVPIVLNSVSQETSAEGTPDEVRMITWTLTFSAKAYLFGPISADGTKLIKSAQANTFNSAYLGSHDRQMHLMNGSGTFKVGELVYEGDYVSAANATAFVKSWDSRSNTLIVEDTKNIFTAGNKIKGAVTNATYVIDTFALADYKLTNLTVSINPLTANSNDAFGFIETLEEAPNIV